MRKGGGSRNQIESTQRNRISVPLYLVVHLLEANMKKALILSVLLLALSASIAMAAPGLNLAWDDCGTFGNADRGAAAPFSCNSNSNTLSKASNLYGTYVAPGITDLVGNEAVVDYQVAGGTMPLWWNFTDTACLGGGAGRAGQLLFTFRNGSSCLDWPGSAGVSGNMTVTNTPPDRARIKLIGAYTSGTPQTLVMDSEYNSFLLTINNAGTLGSGCPGCATAVCIVLNSIKLNEFPAASTPIVIANPANANFVTWRGGSPLVCPGATPTHKSSWGQLKSLYR